MDLLFKRYANPFSLLDGYIQTSRFCEFIETFLEQKVEDDRWEFYLHRVWDKSYTDFRDEMRRTQNAQSMSEADVEATVKQSMDILGNFNPEKGEGEK
jgi:hypothetical protein